MQQKKEKLQNRFEALEWFRIFSIISAYILTFGGIIFVIPWLFSLSESLLIGFLLLVIVIPLFPAMQISLVRKEQTNLFMFLKIYVAEFATLFMQLSLLLVSAPFIAIMVAGRLVIALLIAAAISWLIVGFQQLGLKIGSKMLRADIIILFWVTIGLIVAAGIFYLLDRLIKKHEDSYFSLWANQFVKIREFFRFNNI